MKLLYYALITILIAALAGCAAQVNCGPANSKVALSGVVVVAPFRNATEDDHAGQVFSDLIATELSRRGLSVVILPPKPANNLGEATTYTNEDLAAVARKQRASGIVCGTALELRYKTDLDGDPAAGVYVEIRDPSAKNAVWHASGAHTGLIYSSLSGTAQKVSRDVVAKMPLR